MSNSGLFHKSVARRKISLTPLIDLVFLLLVFFITTTHFDKFSYLSVSLPMSGAIESNEHKTVAIELIDDIHVLIDGHKMELEKLLSTIPQETNNAILLIDHTISVQLMANVMLRLRQHRELAIDIKQKKIS